MIGTKNIFKSLIFFVVDFVCLHCRQVQIFQLILQLVYLRYNFLFGGNWSKSSYKSHSHKLFYIQQHASYFFVYELHFKKFWHVFNHTFFFFFLLWNDVMLKTPSFWIGMLRLTQYIHVNVSFINELNVVKCELLAIISNFFPF